MVGLVQRHLRVDRPFKIGSQMCLVFGPHCFRFFIFLQKYQKFVLVAELLFCPILWPDLWALRQPQPANNRRWQSTFETTQRWQSTFETAERWSWFETNFEKVCRQKRVNDGQAAKKSVRPNQQEVSNCSGDPNTGHSNTGNNQNLDRSVSGIQMVLKNLQLLVKICKPS